MRITFVLPVVGMRGGVKVVAIHAKALAARGHAVTLISPPPPALPILRKARSFLAGDGWPADVSAYPSHIDGNGLDHRVLDRWRPVTDNDVPDADVVIATWWETAEWVNSLSPRKGAKVYYIQHHEVWPHLPVSRCRATYRMAMHKIVIARWLKETMRKEYSDSIVDVVPNSVDRNQFFADVRAKQPVPTAGFMYSTVPFKGLHVALSAIQRIRENTPNLRLVSFGSERPSATLPIPDRTEFYLAPPQNLIRDIYSQCDVWIASSRSEGFYLPALEAMACRTPVVSTRTGWAEDAIQTGRNGVLVDVDDIEGLARGVESVLALPDSQWRKLSSAAHKTASAGSWSESTRQFETALLNACRRANNGEIAGACGCSD